MLATHAAHAQRVVDIFCRKCSSQCHCSSNTVGQAAGALRDHGMHPHTFHVLLSLSSLAALAGTASAQIMTAVSPQDRTTLEGSSFTHFPIGRASARMQTLHADLAPGTLLSGHAYRRDAVQVRGVVDAFSCDMQVTLSMSTKLPTQASTTFAQNRGTNPVVVLPRTIIAFPATNRPSIDMLGSSDPASACSPPMPVLRSSIDRAPLSYTKICVPQ